MTAPIPEGVRIAVYNAMGGWGPYSVREVEELFRTYGFTETRDVGDVGGVRRSTAEAFQECIDWGDEDERRRYLMLVEDVLENYPEVDGRLPAHARAVRRALRLAASVLPSQEPSTEPANDLWVPPGAVRVFISHLAERKAEVHQLARVLRAIGFACFVAHDEIRPSRSWLREIERALQSADLLVAYTTPGFHNSEWTDQEVGWALGRELVIVPISVDSENPYGFFGTYQAVRRTADQDPISLGRDVFRAISDGVFQGQRSAAAQLVGRIAAMVSNAFCQARTYETARYWYEMLATIPPAAWTPAMRSAVDGSLDTNSQLKNAVLNDAGHTPLPDAVRTLLATNV